MLRDAIKHQDTFNIAKAFRYKSEYFKKKGITDSAFYYLLKAERAYVILNDRVNLGKVLLAKGVTQYYGNDYLGAELSITKAYGLLKNSTEKQLLYESVTMMGIIANDLKDYDKAIEYHTKAFQLAKEHNLNDELNQEATSLNNIGNVYQNTNQDKNAIHYFSLALSNKKNIIKDFPGLFAMLTDNLAYSKFKLGDNNGLPQLFFDALRIRDSLGFNSGIVYSKLHLSEYYAAIQDTVKAKNYSEEAFATAKKSGAPSDILASLQQLATVDHKKASSYSREYIKITDSLQQAERKSKDKFARIQFETDEISLEKDKLEEQNRNLLLFFVGTVMIGLLLFVIRNQRARNRELLHKQAQQKANEDIYNLMLSQQNKIEEGRIQEKKRIAQELHDGVLGRLFGARLNLDSLNKLDGEHAEEKRNNYLAELKNIEQDIREISHDLNREKFVLINNFIAILNNLLEEQAASFDAEVVVNVDQSIKWERISNSLKINLYRIVQEALQNINKYAKASQIQVHLKQQNGNIVLNITDNGVGFAVEKKSKGIGLQNMVSRANECEGFFDIKSKKGKGTTINIEFPIENKPITA
jgi:signal transduction histidine kinase